MSESPHQASSSVGRRLLSALTENQVEALLTGVAEAGFLTRLVERLRSADPDLADTVGRFLETEPSAEVVMAASDRKALEMWNHLWGDWESCVTQLGDAEGDYANHEEHWHPPYFDSMALTEDLEKAAQPMLEWLDRAFPLVKKPDLFRAGVGEIDEGIRSFPDWMQPFEDCCVLGPQATTCALRWTWLGFTNESSPGPQFADSLHGLENEVKRVDLDTDACVRFFSQLPEGAARAILAHLRTDDYAESVADVRSVWHRVRL